VWPAAKAIAGAIRHPVDTAKQAMAGVKALTPEKVGGAIGAGLPGAALGKGASALTEAAGPATFEAVQPAVKAARDAGYILKPSEVGAGAAAKAVEGVSGSPRLSVTNSVKNQTVTNKLAGEEINHKGRLTKPALEETKKPHNAVYKEMEEIGEIPSDAQYSADIEKIGRTPGKTYGKDTNPDVERLRKAYAVPVHDSRDAVLKVRELRSKGFKNIKAPYAPEKNELGKAQLDIANSIENLMERHVAAGEQNASRYSAGKGNLLQRFRTARKELAKINSVQQSLVGATGDVSAKNLSRMQEHGVPLSGKLKLIADTHDEFGESMKTAKKTPNKVPLTTIDALTLGGRGAVRKLLQHPAIQKRLGARKVPGARGTPAIGGGTAAAIGAVDENGVGQ
jgi:hypothetical protein